MPNKKFPSIKKNNTILIYPIVFYELSNKKLKNNKNNKKKNQNFGMPKRDRTPEKYQEPEIYTVFSGEDEQDQIQEILQNEDTKSGDYIIVSGMAQGDYKKGRISKDKNGNLRILKWNYDF